MPFVAHPETLRNRLHLDRKCLPLLVLRTQSVHVQLRLFVLLGASRPVSYLLCEVQQQGSVLGFRVETT